MTKQKGFTLIELIIVIVILGALAVVAVPRFIDLSEEAEEASAEGVFGAAQSAAAITFAASLVQDTPPTAITAGSSLLGAMQSDPDGWESFTDNGDEGIENTDTGWRITIDSAQTDDAPAELSLSET